MRRPALAAAARASVLLCAFAVALSACAGAPPAREADADGFYRLGAGAAVYLTVDVAAARPILDAAIAASIDPERRRGAADALDRTRSAYAAFFGGGAERFRVAAYGDYPRTRASISLALDKNWKKVAGDRPYWRSKNGFSLAFDRAGSALLSDGDPWAESAAPAAPASFALLDPAAPLRAWISAPSERMASSLGPAADLLRVRVDELVLGVNRDGDLFRVEAIATVAGEREARALAALLRLARGLGISPAQGSAGRMTDLVLGSAITVEGSVLRILAEPLSADEIARLFAIPAGSLL